MDGLLEILYKTHQFIFGIPLYLHLEKGMVLYLEKTPRIPFIQERFVPSLIEIGPMVLKKMKMWKVKDRKIGSIAGNQKSSLELSAQVS